MKLVNLMYVGFTYLRALNSKKRRLQVLAFVHKRINVSIDEVNSTEIKIQSTIRFLLKNYVTRHFLCPSMKENRSTRDALEHPWQMLNNGRKLTPKALAATEYLNNCNHKSESQIYPAISTRKIGYEHLG